MDDLVVRGCEGCTACCIYFPFGDEFGEWAKYVRKGAGVPCRFLHDNKCIIYDIARPDICKGFICAWRVGVGDDWLKPSSCGVIIRKSSKLSQLYELGVDAPAGEDTPYFVFYELIKGSFDEPKMASFIEKVSSKFVVMLRTPYENRYVGDKAAVIKLRSIVSSIERYAGEGALAGASITEWCFSRKHGSG